MKNTTDKIGEGKEPGYFPAYKNPGHNVGITYDTLAGTSIPKVMIDGNPFDTIPNNKSTSGNYKIMDVIPSIVNSVWRLTFKIYVDGRIYEKYIELK